MMIELIFLNLVSRKTVKNKAIETVALDVRPQI